jgi:hypothetical protein
MKWNMYGVLFGKRPLGRLGYRWEDSIETGLRAIQWSCMDEIHMVQDRD